MKIDPRSRRRAALLLAAASWPLASCAFDFGSLLPVKGSGRVVNTELDVAEFDAIDVAGSVVLELVQGQPSHVSIETDDNLAPMIEVQVKNGTLTVHQRANLSPTRLRIVVKVWKLESLAVSGSGRVDAGLLVAKNLRLRLGGSGLVRLDALTAETLDVQAGGSGLARVAGQANSLGASLGGSAQLDARALQVRRAAVTVGGSGQASVWASEALSGSVGGSGQLRYRGDPQLNMSRSGSGQVVRLP